MNIWKLIETVITVLILGFAAFGIISWAVEPAIICIAVFLGLAFLTDLTYGKKTNRED